MVISDDLAEYYIKGFHYGLNWKEVDLVTSVQKMTVLHCAAMHANVAVMEWVASKTKFLKHTFRKLLEVQDEYGRTPLMLAVGAWPFESGGDRAIEATKWLIEHGANVGASPDRFGRTVISSACRYFPWRVVEFLLPMVPHDHLMLNSQLGRCESAMQNALNGVGNRRTKEERIQNQYRTMQKLIMMGIPVRRADVAHTTANYNTPILLRLLDWLNGKHVQNHTFATLVMRRCVRDTTNPLTKPSNHTKRLKSSNLSRLQGLDPALVKISEYIDSATLPVIGAALGPPGTREQIYVAIARSVVSNVVATL